MEPDFAKALSAWMEETELTDAALGLRLYPPIGYNGVRGWRIGKSEPARVHRRQLIKVSKGRINHKHFT